MQALCTFIGRSWKARRTIELIYWLNYDYFSPGFESIKPHPLITIVKFLSTCFVFILTKATNQKTLSYDVGVRNRNMYLKVPIPYSHVVWEGENYLFHERYLCNIFNPIICFHKVRWFEKVLASYSINGSCVTDLNLQIFVNAHHQFIPPFIVYREIYMVTKYKCLLTSLLTNCERGPGWLNELGRWI